MSKYPEEIVEKVARAITESGIGERGNNVRDWPDDEAAAYRDNGGWSEGNHAALAIRAQKAAIAALDALGLTAEWADYLTNDGVNEYTTSSDCDGSNEERWQRRPAFALRIEATPWEVVDQ